MAVGMFDDRRQGERNECTNGQKVNLSYKGKNLTITG